MVDEKPEKKYLEALALDQRLLIDKNADPVLIVDALDKLADVNFRSLNQTNSLVTIIHQTLGRGLKYPSSPGSDLLKYYSSLKKTVFEMIDHISNLTYSGYSGESPKDHRAVFDSIDKKINPPLENIHNLFIFGYHIPSPLSPAQTSSEINVLSMLNHFNSLFAEPVKKVSYLLAGGSKPKVKLNTVETTEELIRVLHDVGLGRIKHLLHDIVHQDYYDHLKKVELCKGLGVPYIQGLGNSEAAIFKNSQIWPIAEALIEYAQTDNSVSLYGKIMSIYALITTKSLSSSIMLSFSIVRDSANCSLHVLYDSNQQNYDIDFFCGNKGHFSPGFMSKVKESFTSLGYKYGDAGRENKAFWLSKKSDTKSAKQDVRFILDNLKNNLISSHY